MFIIALLAALLHIGWVLVLWNAPGPIHAVAISPFYVLFTSSRQVAVMLLLVSLLTVAGKLRWRRGWPLFLSLLPQQVTLMMTAWSAFFCVYHSAYADGVLRSRAFIFADQWGNIIPAVLHSGYVIWVFTMAVMKPPEAKDGTCGMTRCPLRVRTIKP